MRRPLLLDTCAMIWMGDNEKLSSDAITALDEASDEDEPVAVSAISAWEIGMLASKGRFASPLAPEEWFNTFLRGGSFRLSGLSPEVLIASSFLPGAPPNDPIDRIIIATARHENRQVVTRDRAMLAYGAAGHVGYIAC